MLHNTHAVKLCNPIGIRCLYLHWMQDSNSRHVTFNLRSVTGSMDKVGLVLTRKNINSCVRITLHALG